MESRSQAIVKVRKLRALAASTTFEGERDTATRMANVIILKWSITEEELSGVMTPPFAVYHEAEFRKAERQAAFIREMQRQQREMQHRMEVERRRLAYLRETITLTFEYKGNDPNAMHELEKLAHQLGLKFVRETKTRFLRSSVHKVAITGMRQLIDAYCTIFGLFPTVEYDNDQAS